MAELNHPTRWIAAKPEGLYCIPGGFYIDPVRPVERAVITHGHADHARAGHGAVLATPETVAIMKARFGEGGTSFQALPYGQTIGLGGVSLRLVPAGHVLGSAQVVLEYGGGRFVASGDYKRQPDPTCAPFEVVPCDVFVTEATFALPVFRHPAPEGEIARLLASLELFPERAHVVGAYALGKAQRLIALLRQAGWDRPVYLHGALQTLCSLYEAHGVPLGELRPVPPAARGSGGGLGGEVVLAPPSSLATAWARRLAEPLTAAASGWMRVRQRARQGGVELPLIISDHVDWPALNATIDEVGAPEVWITHGRDDALIHALAQRGIQGRALALIGLGEGEDEEPAAA